MKKLTAIVLTLLLISTCSVTAFANEGRYDTAGDLYQAWGDNMPDYICGVWSADGGMQNLTFGIQNSDEGNAGKQEMLLLIKDDSTVSFVYQKHSRNYLLQIQEDLYAYFQKDLGLILAGLNERENRIDLEINEQKRNDNATKEMIAELTSNYGDAISIAYTDHLLTTTTLETGDPIPNHPPYFLFAIMIGVFFLSAAFALAVKKKRTAAMRTNAGNTWTTSVPLTTKAVKDMARHSHIPISSDVDIRIMAAIEKTEK